ncbi:unnamed protein product [Brassica oleracea var. botrytis]
MAPPATERRNKSSDPGPVPNPPRVKLSPFTAPDSANLSLSLKLPIGKVVIHPSSSGGWDEGVIGMQIGEVARLRHVVSKVCVMKALSFIT